MPRAAAFALSGGSAAGLAAAGGEGGGFCWPRAGKEGREHAKGYLGCGKPRGGRRESPQGRLRGQPGPPEAERCGRCAGERVRRPSPRRPGRGGRGKARTARASPRGGPGGHCPHGPSPGGVPGQGLEPDGSAGWAPLPTAGTGRRQESGGGAGCAGPCSLAGVEGTERGWGARVPPVNTAAGQNTSDGSTPRLPHR